VLWTLRSMLLAPFSVKMMDPGTKEWWKYMIISLMIFYIPTLITLWFCRKSWYESHQWSL
jgi:hypothetical protein